MIENLSVNVSKFNMIQILQKSQLMVDENCCFRQSILFSINFKLGALFSIQRSPIGLTFWHFFFVVNLLIQWKSISNANETTS